MFIGQTSSDYDSVTNTFSQNNHPEFYIGSNQITADSCDSTNIYSEFGKDTAKFYEVLLADGALNIIYTAILENDLFGFDSKSHDFEMIVGENGKGGDVETTPYYFYLELQ